MHNNQFSFWRAVKRYFTFVTQLLEQIDWIVNGALVRA